MMAGTSLYSDYQDVRDSVGYACEVAQTEKVQAAGGDGQARGHERRGGGRRVPFNPLPWKRKALVEFYTEKDPRPHPFDPATPKSQITHLRRRMAAKIPLQWRPSESMTNFFQRAVSVGRSAGLRL